MVAAVPMTWALATLGGRGAYLAAAAAGRAGARAAAGGARRAGGALAPRAGAVAGAIRASLAASWAHPGTRLGFWMHFSTQFSATTLGLLWGYPFLVRGEGRSRRPSRGCC